MKVTVTAKELGDIFTRAHDSLFSKNGILPVNEQRKGWKRKFHAKISGGHFDRSYLKGKWNTHDAVVEFENEAAYVLFMLEWS